MVIVIDDEGLFIFQAWKMYFINACAPISLGSNWTEVQWIARSDVPDHYNDVIMSLMSSLITSLTIVYWSVYSGTDQRKHQSSASLAFVRGIHRWPVNSPHKKASNAENVSIWRRHHVLSSICFDALDLVIFCTEWQPVSILTHHSFCITILLELKLSVI